MVLRERKRGRKDGRETEQRRRCERHEVIPAGKCLRLELGHACPMELM
jgi:hypothetical protein